MSLRLGGALVGFIAVGCTSVLGIDGQYVLEASQDSGFGNGGASGGVSTGTGGTGIAGSSGTGGVPETGGTGGNPQTGGSPSSGGVGGASSCANDATVCGAGQKCCSVVCDPQNTACDPTQKSCVAATPIVGCESPGCNGCPQPANAKAICNAQGACDFECVAGSTRVGNACQTSGSGGTGGSPSATCDPIKCQNTCNIAGPFRCCRMDGACGCTWAVGAACYL